MGQFLEALFAWAPWLRTQPYATVREMARVTWRGLTYEQRRAFIEIARRIRQLRAAARHGPTGWRREGVEDE